ncbi:uncharacterized protein N7484_008456 [Penicillium longicatenatum]|uniref:uncharacterized protein n=1 Tax=Penicillium longicatenatum TaxID=1561947 RepID=UPI002549BEA4|nr:uncharacterized protein N7484_008456 [Penicillium longicatenatum]KAJ5635143.1 hypothetical protein N7484_008456 [Penicillium longicatenatum]
MYPRLSHHSKQAANLHSAEFDPHILCGCEDVHGGKRDEITRACQVEDTHLIAGTPATPDGRGAVFRQVELLAIDMVGTAGGSNGETRYLGLKGTASRGGGCGGLSTGHSGSGLRDHDAREGLSFKGTECVNGAVHSVHDTTGVGSCSGGIEGSGGGASGDLGTGKRDLAGVPGGDQGGFGDDVVTVGYSKIVDVVEMVVGTVICVVVGPVRVVTAYATEGTDLICCRLVVGNIETLGLAGLVTRLGEDGGGATREKDLVVNAGVGGQLELSSITIFSIVLNEGSIEANGSMASDVLMIGMNETSAEDENTGATVHADGGTCGNVDSGGSGPLNSQTVQHRWRDSELSGDRDGLVKFDGIEVIGPFSRPSVRGFETHDDIAGPAHGRRHEGAHNLTRGGSNHDTAYEFKVGDAQTAVHATKLADRGLHQRLRRDFILHACSIFQITDELGKSSEFLIKSFKNVANNVATGTFPEILPPCLVIKPGTLGEHGTTMTVICFSGVRPAAGGMRCTLGVDSCRRNVDTVRAVTREIASGFIPHRIRRWETGILQGLFEGCLLRGVGVGVIDRGRGVCGDSRHGDGDVTIVIDQTLYTKEWSRAGRTVVLNSGSDLAEHLGRAVEDGVAERISGVEEDLVELIRVFVDDMAELIAGGLVVASPPGHIWADICQFWVLQLVYWGKADTYSTSRQQ